jgi:hypothetical protein
MLDQFRIESKFCSKDVAQVRPKDTRIHAHSANFFLFLALIDN